MKHNLPVTNVEQPYPGDRILVSKTDLKGIITYANDAFIEACGFSEQELIGKNHNIVRHPDVPPEAFEYVWNTIQKGNSWRGVVKNRCKNGDHYWADALIVPVRENNRTTGYMSVRRRPTPERIEAAEKLYRGIREKRVKLKSGPLSGLLGAFSFNARYALFIAIMVALALAAALLGVSGMPTMALWRPGRMCF